MNNLKELTKKLKPEDDINYKHLFVNDSVFKNAICGISTIECQSSDKYQAFFNLAKIIFWKRDESATSSDQSDFTVTKFQISYQLFIYDWSRFHWKSIPFFEWEDLYNEGVNILTALINENNLENFENDERYKKFTEAKRQRLLDLMDKYDSLYEYSI